MKTKRKPPSPTPWTIPVDCRLPDSVAEIEAGRLPQLRQRELFPDDVMSRLKAVKQAERGKKSR